MPAVLIHGGAGAASPKLRDHEAECRAALREALDSARAVLESGGDALDAAQAAVMVMEAFELFNAGRGAALTSDGSAELSAAVMRGSDRAAGAVAGARHTRHPILAARAVLASSQVLLIGARADEHAAAAGAEQVANAYFVTERQRGLLETRRHADTHGTVGAVCLDDAGVLAAATSTGGITGQPAGRVGDSPLFGAGTWADDHVAVSCTGDGEAFVRTAAARYLAALVERGALPEPAADAALAEVATLGGSGGLIALDAHGRGAMPFLTEAMPRGRWHSGGEPEVWVP